jgi:hypothetical protein
VNSDLDVEFMGVNGKPETSQYLYEAIVGMPPAKFMHFCNKLSSFWDTGDMETGT